MRKFYNIPENQLIGEGIDSNLYNTYFYVEDISGEDGNECIITKSDIDAPDVYLEYSYDQINWITLPVTSVDGYSIRLYPNSKLYLRGENEKFGEPNGYTNKIDCKKNYSCNGNISSLLCGSKFINSIPTGKPGTFYDLFRDSTTIIYSHKLIIDRFIPSQYSFTYMFRNCINLQTCPKIYNLYGFTYCVFEGFLFDCISLNNDVYLSANTVYSFYFARCFYGCQNIKKAYISIKNQSIQDYGFNSLFCDARNLNYVKCNFQHYNNSNNQFNNWLQNVSPTGTFLLPVGSSFADNAPRNGSGIPEGWEIKYFNPETDEIIN